jgi:hypothetical protein
MRDESAYASAGATTDLERPPESRERSCPYVAHIEVLGDDRQPPRIHALQRDVTLIGSGPGDDIQLDARGAAPRSLVLVRGWSGFTVLPLTAGLRLNRSVLNGRALLGTRDEIAIGPHRLRFVGRLYDKVRFELPADGGVAESDVLR